MENPVPADLAWYRYRLRFRQPGGGNARSSRQLLEGFLIRTGGGYACLQPWPELGDPSLSGLWEILASRTTHPLLERALEGAAADAAARGRGESLFGELPFQLSHATVPGRADFPGLYEEGFRCVKLKGQAQWEKILQLAGEAFSSGLKVRIDFNGVLKPEEFYAFAHALGDLREGIEFVEDPTPWDPAVWNRLSQETGLRLALDRGVPAEAGSALGVGKGPIACDNPDEACGYQVRILKPAVDRMEPRAVPVVITSYMDHPLGVARAAWEAARFPGSQLAGGWMTHRLFEEDEFSERLATSGPVWRPPGGTGLGFDDLLANLPWVELRSANPHRRLRVSPVQEAPGFTGLEGDSASMGGRQETPGFRPDPGVPLPEGAGAVAGEDSRDGSTPGVVHQNPRDPLPGGGPVLKPGEIGFPTSGSTGIPSVIVHMEDSLRASAEAVNTWLASTSEDVWLLALPEFHVGGYQISLRASLTGSRVCRLAEGKWDPAAFCAICRREEVTLTALVPTQMIDLVRSGTAAPASLRAVIIGGGALDPETLAAAQNAGWPLLLSYGSTEGASQIATARPGGDPAELWVLPHWSVRVLPGASTPVPDPSSPAAPGSAGFATGLSHGTAPTPAPWETGRLCLQGPALAHRRMVWKRGAWISETLREEDGWYVTPDLVQTDGVRLRFAGRTGRAVKILGELVDLSGVEQRLCEAGFRPATFAVVPLADARSGHFLVLVVESGIDSAAVGLPIFYSTTSVPEGKEWARQLLGGYNAAAAPFARIRHWAFVAELPRSPLGKIRHAELTGWINSAVPEDTLSGAPRPTAPEL